MKQRIDADANYKAIWTASGKTYRFALKEDAPITEPSYPEFYDVKITNDCGGKCPYCYQNSVPQDESYGDIIWKMRQFLDAIPNTERPFQVALGGGEVTTHPQFYDLLKMLKEEYDICPNFTTNGMWAGTGDMWFHVEECKKYIGGAALTAHKHLRQWWKQALDLYQQGGIRTNLHVVISDAASIDYFLDLFNYHKSTIEYFVLLPYMNVGRASTRPLELDWEYFKAHFPTEDREQSAFGANFYPYLQRNELPVKLSLYEPEMFSKYLDLRGHGYLYPSSFSDTILAEEFWR